MVRSVLDTDDHILEAKWRTTAASREQADVFAAKVRTKGRNALGVFVIINGFTSTFIDRFAGSTPFITIDGEDLFMVLDDRIRLDALRAKRRQANDTGTRHYPVRSFLTSILGQRATRKAAAALRMRTPRLRVNGSGLQ